MNLDHAFVEQVLQQFAYASVGWLASRSVRALRQRILGPPAAVVVLVEVGVRLDHVLPPNRLSPPGRSRFSDRKSVCERFVLGDPRRAVRTDSFGALPEQISRDGRLGEHHGAELVVGCGSCGE
jgi:hypothetical protein